MSSDQYHEICKEEFAQIQEKLDRLDEAIRGNGEPGLKTRIDRLERSETTRSRLLWLIAGSAVTGAISLVGSLILQALKGL